MSKIATVYQLLTVFVSLTVNERDGCLLMQVLWHWSHLVKYHKQLDAAAELLSTVGETWWARHCLHRWQGVVEVMAGQRSAELRELVQLRACIGYVYWDWPLSVLEQERSALQPPKRPEQQRCSLP